MNQPQVAPNEDFFLTHFLVVTDQDRSREFYLSLFGGQVLREREPVIIKAANTRLILNTGGGPPTTSPASLFRHQPTQHIPAGFSTCG